MAFLEVKDLYVNYGAIKAIQGVSFHINKGEIVTLIGANGAGKSTIMNTLAGLVRASSGKVIFDGKDITNAPNEIIVKSGICLAPEGRQIFPRMTVLENLKMGSYTIKDKAVVQKNFERVFNLFPRLKERINQLGGTLSGGEQQMLAIARALMAEPRLLMLDEPSLGLAPIIVQELFELLKEINREGTTILLVEQNARLALRISHRGYVLETGKIVLSDTSENLEKSPKVRESYLGG